MIIYNLLSMLWIVFIVYWIVSALSTKRTVQRNWKDYRFQMVIILALIIFSDSKFFRGWHGYAPVSNPFGIQVVGLLFALVGITLAMWARIYLGTNWGMPMSLKENPELVTAGPYSYIRHPIYTGVLLAMIGSTLIIGIQWLIPFIVFCGYFIYSATKEEKIMLKQFPNEYPEYKKKTKMLIPFLF